MMQKMARTLLFVCSLQPCELDLLQAPCIYLAIASLPPSLLLRYPYI